MANDKETKQLHFIKSLGKEDLPGYIHHYVLDDERVLVVYKTSRDHGIFTDRKIVLFDSTNGTKEIFTIPYSSISTISVSFKKENANFSISLGQGTQLELNFDAKTAEDKVRLRILYTCINRIISNQKPSLKDIRRLMNDDVAFH